MRRWTFADGEASRPMRAADRLRKTVPASSAVSKTFEDSHSVDWLNVLVRRLWPHIDKAVQRLIADVVEPKIRESAPVILNSLKFSEFSLGTKAAELGPIRVFEDGDNFLLGIRVAFASDSVIEISANRMQLGVKSLHISGELMVSLQQLVDKLPIIGGIVVYFLNPPKVDYDLTGIADTLTQNGVISRTLRDSVQEAIYNVLVTPNQIMIQLGEEEDGVDTALMKTPSPIAVLQISAVNAHNLKGLDWNLFGSSMSDPYVQARLGNMRWRSEHVQQTVNPVWPEAEPGHLLVYNVQQKLWISVWDKDPVGSDLLGYVEALTITEAMEMNQSPMDLCESLDLDGKREAGENRGDLTLSFRLWEIIDSKSNALPDPSATLSVLKMRVKTIRLPSKLGSTALVKFCGAGMETQETPVGTVPEVPKTVVKLFQDVILKLEAKGMKRHDIAEVMDMPVDDVVKCWSAGEVHSSAKVSPCIQVNALLHAVVPDPFRLTGSFDVIVADENGATIAKKTLQFAELAKQQRDASRGEPAFSGVVACEVQRTGANFLPVAAFSGTSTSSDLVEVDLQLTLLDVREESLALQNTHRLMEITPVQMDNKHNSVKAPGNRHPPKISRVVASGGDKKPSTAKTCACRDCG
eukprot:TRINITY_DN5911_c0_g1_i1.p1 TRINITY_DN5911_c0_g1~~TRINITY_DN5911_c0_g1_i1.p1  ORF type:complete len:637 (-),score=116.58 TRINITY_DN5911_c0_g1_i1:133-2043(-)